MKKIICILLALIFTSVSAYAGTEASNAIEELKSYNILTTHDADSAVTRGEMAQISLRLQGIGGSIGTGNSVFFDVDSNHPYAAAIGAAAEMGIFSGYGDGKFYPDNVVTAEQAIKVIVTSLGYDVFASELGGYPMGYIGAAGRINLLKGIEISYSEELTRSELAQMLLNILDEYPLVSTYGDEISYHRDTRTVRQILENNTGTISVTGRIVENGATSLYGESELDKDQIRIGSAIYNTGETAISEYLGMEVTAFVDSENTRAVPTVIGFYVNADSQRVVTVDSDAVESVSLKEMTVSEDIKTKTYNFVSAPSVIYNGKHITPSQDDLEIYRGSYTLIDFDSNSTYDVIFITEKESFLVDRVYMNNVYFDNNRLFRGANGFSFDYDSDDAMIEIYNPDGELCDISFIKSGMNITFVCSMDKKLVKAYVSDKTHAGTITAIDAHKGIAELDGTAYRLALSADGHSDSKIKLGVSSAFAITYDGELLCLTQDAMSEYTYVYVENCRKLNEFGGLALRVIGSGSRKSEEKTVGNTTTLSYKIQNGDFETIELADTVTCDGVRVKSSEIKADSLPGKVIGYKLNSDGKINDMNTYSFSGALNSLKANTDIFSFGGFLGAQNFLVSDATQLICVPETPNTDDDYFMLVTLNDNSQYDVFPIEVDEESQIAEAAVIVEVMDSSTPVAIDSDTKASIVGKVSAVMDENGDECYKLQILTGNTEYELLTKDSNGTTAQVVSKLSTGDVIKYSFNAFGRIDNIDVLASLYNADEYFRTNPNTLREKIYGQCYEIKRHRLSEGLNEFVDEITVRTSPSSATHYEVLCTDGPYYYIFDRKKGVVMSAISDDVADYVNVTDNASNLYMFVKDNEPQVVVIVKD